jgi:hypothetical protein
MRWELHRLEQMKKRKEQQSYPPYNFVVGSHTHSIAIGGGGCGGSTTIEVPEIPIPPKEPNWDAFRAELTGRVNGMECCLRCGRFYHPYVGLEQEELQERIDELRAEVLSPLEVLAHEG